MPSSSPVPSAPGLQTIYSEVTNQAFVITDIQAQLSSISRRQDELVDFVTNLQQGALGARTESAVSGPLIAAQPSPEQPSNVIPKVEPVGFDIMPHPSGHGVEPTVMSQTNTRTRQTSDPKRRIRRHNAFYHISNAEEPPWTAPGGYHPRRDGGHPTPDRPTTKRPAHPPIQLSETQGARAIPPPAATPTLRTHPAPTANTRPSRRDSPYYYVVLIGRAPPVAPGSDISQPPPYPPTTAPTTSAPSHPSPKRKREDGGGAMDDEGSDKKRLRCASTDGVDGAC